MIYHETEHGVLYHGDCLDIMKMIPDNSVDWESLVSGMQETIDMMKDEKKTLEEYISIQEKVIDIAAKELERQSAGCPRDTHPDFNTLLGCCTDYPLRDMAECWRNMRMACAGVPSRATGKQADSDLLQMPQTEAP